MFASLLAAAALLAAPYAKSWTFDAGQKPLVKASNVNGKLEIVGGRGSSVEVQATGKDAGDFHVEAFQEGDEVHVSVCCGEGCGKHQRRHGERCEGGRIDLKLTVPARSEVSASNVSGPLRVEGVEGRQSLNNVSGRIVSSGTAGDLKVNTVSGDVELAPQRLAATKLNSVSGSVDLRVPRDASATIKLSTVSGSVHGDVGEGSGTRWKIGAGEEPVRANSVSGSIRVSAQ